MGRRVLLVSVVLLLIAFPALVAAQRPATPVPDPDTSQTPPPTPTVPIEPPAPAEPLTPTILSEPVVPVPVIPSSMPPVEGVPPPPTISSALVRLLPTLTTVGASRPVFMLQPSLSLSEEYSDNFDLTKTDRHSNFRTAIAPTLLFSLDSAFTKGIIAYTFTANHDSFQNDMVYFHSVLGQVSWDATPRLRFTIADAFTHNDEPTQADSLNLRRQRATFTSNAFSLTSDYLIDRVATREYYRWNTFSDTEGDDTTTQAVGITASLPLYTENTLTLGYEYLTSRTTFGDQTSQGNTQTFQGTQDVTAHQLTGSLGRKLNALLTAGISGNYAFYHLSGAGTTNSDNFQLWTATLFATYGTAPFTVTGNVGVTGLTSDSGGSRGPELALSATASYAFARAVASLTLEHGFSTTFATGENFGVVETTGASGSLSYSFTTRTSGTVSAYYRKTQTTGVGGGQTLGGSPNISGGSNDVDEGVGATAALTVGLLRWLKLGFTYTYTQRFDSGTSGTTTTTQGSFNSNAGYSENRARISLDMNF